MAERAPLLPIDSNVLMASKIVFREYIKRRSMLNALLVCGSNNP